MVTQERKFIISLFTRIRNVFFPLISDRDMILEERDMQQRAYDEMETRAKEAETRADTAEEKLFRLVELVKKERASKPEGNSQPGQVQDTKALQAAQKKINDLEATVLQLTMQVEALEGELLNQGSIRSQEIQQHQQALQQTIIELNKTRAAFMESGERAAKAEQQVKEYEGKLSRLVNGVKIEREKHRITMEELESRAALAEQRLQEMMDGSPQTVMATDSVDTMHEMSTLKIQLKTAEMTATTAEERAKRAEERADQAEQALARAQCTYRDVVRQY